MYTPEPSTPTPQDEAIKRIEEKLSIIEKKLSDKWKVPVALAILGACLTLGNWLVQREFLNSDIRKNELNKQNAGFISRSTSDFYKTCYEKLDTISKNFESYCIISPSREEDSIITAHQIKLTSLIDHQFPIDPKVKRSLQEYINYVSDKLIDYESESPSEVELKDAFSQSKMLYDKAVTEINAAFVNPER